MDVLSALFWKQILLAHPYVVRTSLNVDLRDIATHAARVWTFV